MAAPVPAPSKSTNYVALAEKAGLVFLTTFAVSFAATPEPYTWKLASAAVAAATVAVNDTLPVGPLSALVDAILGALGHIVPSAKARLVARRAAR